MGKLDLKPAVALFPMPVTLVTVGEYPGVSNILSIAWACPAGNQPPMLSLCIGPRKHSLPLLKAGGEFVVNLADEKLLWAADRCGTTSGRDVDKWSEFGLTPVKADKVKPPLIAECPVSMECVVRQVVAGGNHEIFIGEVVALHADESAVDEGQRIDPGRIAAIGYSQAQYWSLGRKLGMHGYSNKK